MEINQLEQIRITYMGYGNTKYASQLLKIIREVKIKVKEIEMPR